MLNPALVLTRAYATIPVIKFGSRKSPQGYRWILLSQQCSVFWCWHWWWWRYFVTDWNRLLLLLADSLRPEFIVVAQTDRSTSQAQSPLKNSAGSTWLTLRQAWATTMNLGLSVYGTIMGSAGQPRSLSTELLCSQLCCMAASHEHCTDVIHWNSRKIAST